MNAHNIAATPELYNKVCLIKGHEWECLGYSNSGRSVKFSRLVVTETNKIRIITIYVKPTTELKIVL